MTLTANTAIRESLRNMGKLSENRLKSLEKQFHVAYHIALQGRPYNDFVHEVQKLHKVVFQNWFIRERISMQRI